MFTGIILAVGEVESPDPRPGGARLRVRCRAFGPPDTVLGDSIAVNGVCLTVAELFTDGFAADLSAETLARTTLGGLAAGGRVNLEPALRLGDRLGGHLVSGHVDGVGTVLRVESGAGGARMRIRAPEELARYIARKGSICMDGVSLTVNEVSGSEFELTLVPHTLAATTLGQWIAGQRVNLEVDLVARYLERLTESR
jgi:riboflavin synthase